MIGLGPVAGLAAAGVMALTTVIHTPILATTGNDALRKFYDEHPDLVILDVALPGLDESLEVGEELRPAVADGRPDDDGGS